MVVFENVRESAGNLVATATIEADKTIAFHLIELFGDHVFVLAADFIIAVAVKGVPGYSEGEGGVGGSLGTRGGRCRSGGGELIELFLGV